MTNASRGSGCSAIGRRPMRWCTYAIAGPVLAWWTPLTVSTSPPRRDPSLVADTGPHAQANRKGDAKEHRRREDGQEAAGDRKDEILRDDSREPRPQRERQARHLRERTERQDDGDADRELEACQ